jgi:alkanesulfonate monooxygenase SsuD/methylene tetrahydromethanopterin reductase-like flavin-dependent oxidoreductase (luciferase family)
MTGVLVARDASSLAAMVARFMDRVGASGDAEAYLAPRRARWVTGTPADAAERIRAFRDAGAQRLLLQHFLPNEDEPLDLLAEVVSSL